MLGRAAAFDAPLMMGRGGKFGVPEQMNQPEHFARFCVVDLVDARAEFLRGHPLRLAISGHSLFKDDDIRLHERMLDQKIPHEWDHGQEHEHAWNSGWLTLAVEALMRGKLASEPSS